MCRYCETFKQPTSQSSPTSSLPNGSSYIAGILYIFHSILLFVRCRIVTAKLLAARKKSMVLKIRCSRLYLKGVLEMPTC